MKALTDKQRQIYDFIVEVSSKRGYPPSVREICDAVKLSSPSTVHSHIKTLSERGLIEKTAKKTRSLTLPDSNVIRVPIIGRVQAGSPVLAIEEIDGYIPMSMEGLSGEVFALKVRGDSMINAGILEDDFIVVRKQQTANHGEIVVAIIEDEATVKTLIKSNGKIWLKPENENYELIDGSEAKILGIVRAVVRKY